MLCRHSIYNDDTEYRGRERFTLVHALGHYFLHRRQLMAEDFLEGMAEDEADDRTFSCTSMKRHLWQKSLEEIEEEADTCASCLAHADGR